MDAREHPGAEAGAQDGPGVQAVSVVQAGQAVAAAASAGGPAGELAQAPGLEAVISLLLRSGVALSLALVLGGTLLSLAHHPEYLVSAEPLDALVRPAEGGPHSLEAVLQNAREVRGQAFVMLGLLVMVAVPVLRVAVAWAAFRQQRDRAFVRLTSAVLALLLLSFLLGRAGE
jgi:uncharacterized membrane protein